MSGQQHEVTFRFLAQPTDVNFGGKVHGGMAMKWIDQAGLRVCGGLERGVLRHGVGQRHSVRGANPDRRSGHRAGSSDSHRHIEHAYGGGRAGA